MGGFAAAMRLFVFFGHLFLSLLLLVNTVLMIYVNVCLFIRMLPLPTYPFSSLFPYLSPALSFPLIIDPPRFQAGCCKRRPNLALVFLVFILCFSTFLLIGEYLLLWC